MSGLGSVFNRIGKFVGAVILSGVLVGLIEGAAARSTSLGSVIPFQAHIFVLGIILIYMTLTLGEIRERLQTLIDLPDG